MKDIGKSELYMAFLIQVALSYKLNTLFILQYYFIRTLRPYQLKTYRGTLLLFVWFVLREFRAIIANIIE